MQRISKWLSLRLLRRWDKLLLEKYPVVWRTRIHWVLFYAILAFLLLFVAGMLHPVSLNQLTVDPIAPIYISAEPYYYVSLGFAIIATLYWAYTQKSAVRKKRFDAMLLRLLLYGLGLFFILGLDPSAYRLGTIVRTAHYLIIPMILIKPRRNISMPTVLCCTIPLHFRIWIRKP